MLNYFEAERRVQEILDAEQFNPQGMDMPRGLDLRLIALEAAGQAHINLNSDTAKVVSEFYQKISAMAEDGTDKCLKNEFCSMAYRLGVLTMKFKRFASELDPERQSLESFGVPLRNEYLISPYKELAPVLP